MAAHAARGDVVDRPHPRHEPPGWRLSRGRPGWKWVAGALDDRSRRVRLARGGVDDRSPPAMGGPRARGAAIRAAAR
jgi:hypothetical protein